MKKLSPSAVSGNVKTETAEFFRCPLCKTFFRKKRNANFCFEKCLKNWIDEIAHHKNPHKNELDCHFYYK